MKIKTFRNLIIILSLVSISNIYSSKNSSKNYKCIVCLDAQPSTRFKLLNCNHILCCDCIDIVKSYKQSCPHCREPLREIQKCTACNEAITIENRIALKCKHYFHKECIISTQDKQAYCLKCCYFKDIINNFENNPDQSDKLAETERKKDAQANKKNSASSSKTNFELKKLAINEILPVVALGCLSSQIVPKANFTKRLVGSSALGIASVGLEKLINNQNPINNFSWSKSATRAVGIFSIWSIANYITDKIEEKRKARAKKEEEEKRKKELAEASQKKTQK